MVLGFEGHWCSAALKKPSYGWSFEGVNVRRLRLTLGTRPDILLALIVFEC
jgi:hypothetical protein